MKKVLVIVLSAMIFLVSVPAFAGDCPCSVPKDNKGNIVFPFCWFIFNKTQPVYLIDLILITPDGKYSGPKNRLKTTAIGWILPNSIMDNQRLAQFDKTGEIIILDFDVEQINNCEDNLDQMVTDHTRDPTSLIK